MMLGCDRFVQSRTRQEYRKLVAPGFLARGLAKAIKKAGADAVACDIAEEVAHG
jgi:carbon-monoxide dehydrogenase medium subunit/xanthine dehydrogenase FAD-binding subunit